jgi:hypothetical protein
MVLGFAVLTWVGIMKFIILTDIVPDYSYTISHR